MKTTRQPLVSLRLTVWVLFLIEAACLNACRRSSDLAIPDEKVVAMDALISRFSGPRYFHRPSESSAASGDDEFYISVASALDQERRIVRERKLSPQAAERLHRLIEALTEPPSSRLYGDRIHYVRLNLALDELK
ncbi:MAG: hypothetical protein WCO60_00600 [Verrucomicrobiota bacterium]